MITGYLLLNLDSLYFLLTRYESEMALITKAVEIGLNEMSKQAKGQK